MYNVQMLPVAQIVPYANNPRHNQDAVDKVAASIKEFGFKQPIVVDRNMVIIVGHTRLLAAKKLKLKEVPVLVADDLTEEQARAYRLADNKTAEFAEWDFGKLEVEMANILDIDMSQFGFDFQAQEEEQEIIEDEIPEVPEIAKSKYGEVYQLGPHRLMCGDATKMADVMRLMDGTEADLVVTDPPYNMAYEGAGNTRDRASKRIMNDNMSSADFRKFLTSVYRNYAEVMRDGATIYVFYKELGEGVFITSMTAGGLTYKQELIWVKNQLVLGGSKYQSIYEPFLMGCKGKSIKAWNGGRKQRSVIEFVDLMSEDELRETVKDLMDCFDPDIMREKRSVVNDLHPTMKPVRLIAKLVQNSSNENDIVLDFFGGSVTTLIACEQVSRRSYTMELDPHYVDVIIERWENFTGLKAELIREAEDG